LVGKLVDKLGGDTNRDGVSRFALIEITDDGIVQIQTAFDDNVSSGYVKDGARIDTVKVMKVVHDVVGSYSELDLVGTFALQDQLGNSSEEVVVRQYYPKDLLDQINYDNFDFHNAWKISPIPGYVHPAFQGE
jgi:hypothetical protein